MTNNKLAIIIPAFSGHEQLKHCLEAIYNSHCKDFDVIIVDHGVTDRITRSVSTEFPLATCIRGSQELWWSGATNLGIRHAQKTGSEWIMLLNHDCYLHPDTIGTLLNHAENQPDAVIAPVQHLPHSRQEIIGITSCFLLGFPTIHLPAAWYHLRYSSDLIPVHLIGGGRGVILAAKTFHRVGYLDEEHLPHYYADHDFYLRCKQKGVRLFACQNARVDVDDTMTTMANLSAKLSLQQFVTTLKSRSSHRNIRDLQVLFSRYYPIPGLAPLGVALNTTRYFLVYLAKTLVRTIRGDHGYG